jgi:hypothetical protein
VLLFPPVAKAEFFALVFSRHHAAALI